MDLRGTGVALVTPFNEDQTVDLEGLRNVVNNCIEGGLDYLVALGTTGESVVLSNEEKQLVLTKIKEYTAGRVPLVAGFGGNNTQKIVNNIQSFDTSGYSAILSSSPNYNKPSQEGIYQHYKKIAMNAPLPIILYNVPSRTGKNMSAATTVRLANDFDNIIGIKEASNNLSQCIQIAKQVPQSFQLISGDDMNAVPMISFGAVGLISVIAQAKPKLVSKMVHTALEYDFLSAQKILYKLYDFIHLMFEENNPAGIKAALNELGFCKNELRLPNSPVRADLEQRIKELLKTI